MKQGEKPKVLVIENDPLTANTIVDTITGLGVDSEVARDGFSGLKKAADIRPDLILLDIRLGEMNGFETCERLKAEAATKDTPVIFMTALSSTEDKLKGFKAGAVDFITKPFQLREVAMRIGVHLKLEVGNLLSKVADFHPKYHKTLGDDMLSDIAHSVVRSDIHSFPVLITDLNLNIIYSNTKAIWTLGYSDFQGVRFSPDLIAPEYRKIFNNSHPRMTLQEGVAQLDLIGIQMGYGGVLHCGCKIYPIYSGRTQERYGFYIKLLDMDRGSTNPAPPDPMADVSFTRSEGLVLRCALAGMSVKMTADSLNISERTVQNHRQNIRRKLGANADGRSFEQIAQDFQDLFN